MLKNENHEVCVLYTTATCNLNCKYCYIDKNPALLEIDKALKESYKDDYYFNFMKMMFNQNKLKRMEFWGGEPTYGLKRATNIIHQAIRYYPNLKEFMFSTNLTTKTWLKDIIEFCQIFKAYSTRSFELHIQLSLDGPEYINDFNRGKNSTSLFYNNFIKFLSILNDLLKDIPNLKILGHFKPTLDSQSIRLLQTKEKIIEYYLYFESYQNLSNYYVQNPNWQLTLSIPNMANPSPYTQEDGKFFANLCKLCCEVIQENQQKKVFKYFTNIIPHATELKSYCSNASFNDGVKACGAGYCTLGLLPNHMISVCHNGFVELLGEYKNQSKNITELNKNRTIDFELFTNNSKNQLIHSINDYYSFKDRMKCFYCNNTDFSLVELTSLITTHAENGLIDKKYKNKEEALQAAHFIFSFSASCIRDNLYVAKSLYLTQTGSIKLFLNGAKDYIEQFISRRIE